MTTPPQFTAKLSSGRPAHPGSAKASPFSVGSMAGNWVRLPGPRVGRKNVLLAAVLLLAATAITHAGTIVVNSAADPAGYNNAITIPQLGATITLRDAVNAVRNSGGTHTITFAPSLAGQTIFLSQQDGAGGGSALFPYQVGLSAVNLTIQGLTGNNGVTIARASNGPFMRLFACVGADLVMTVNDLTFSGGDVSGSAGWGGAFNVTGASVSINRCTFTGNRAGLGGAIYTASGATLNLSNCTIAGNSATQGGGIYNYDGGPVNLTHTTITNNTAGQGGGLFSYFGGDVLANTMIAGNVAYLAYSEISGNGGNVNLSSSSHHNLVSNAGSAGGLGNGVNGNIVGVNPLLNGLTSNGGPTKTAALSPGSPALNAAAAGLAAIDQRGISRPQGAGADIGAYELIDGAPTTFTSPGSATFVIGFNNSLNVTANGVPSPTFSASGALPNGVTLSAAGVLGGNPSAGTEGTYPLTITATNSGGSTIQSFTLIVISAVVVTTGTDEDNGSPDPALGTGTSLREALNYAQGLGGARTITFAQNLAGQSIDLTIAGDNANGPSALRINTNITIQGLTENSGITIRRASGSFRPFLVFLDASLTLNDLTIADGIAQNGGGIFNFGVLRMNRCTLRNNLATFRGGGFTSGGGGSGQQVTLTNCTLANNQSQFAGGGFANDGTSTITLTNVTIAGNTCTNVNGHGGTEFVGNVTAINTIVAGNTNPSGASDVGGTFNASSHHNLIGTGGSGGLVNGTNGNIVGVQNPGLGTLASNGGATQTVALVGGPAVNAGADVTGVTTDQRGITRPQYNVSDIGAYEFNAAVSPSLVVTTIADELDFSSDPALGTGTSLREALKYAQLLGGAQTITFTPSLAGQTITVTSGWNDANDDTALRVSSDVTVDGGAGVKINLAAPVARRLFLNSSTLTLRNLTLSGGKIQGANDGGALWSNGTATVDKVQFTNNNANYGGAVESSGALTVRNCTFNGNYAQFDGGAVHAGSGAPSLLIENSTFSGNSTGTTASVVASGALQNTYRYLTITNNSGGSGTIDIYQNPATMIDSIVAGNNPDGIVQLNGGVFSAQSTNNLLGPGESGGLTNGVNGNLVGVPSNQLFLGSLGNNGGSTQTIPLLPGSPAIDAGVASAGLTTDQRGTTRPQANAPDIGAFELVWTQAAAIPIVSPLGGTYESSAEISIASTSAGSTVRYTLDGTAPSSSNGQIYSAPFTLMQNATVKAMASGRGWLPSPVASVGYTVLAPLPYWRNLQGLAADGSQDLANPSGDGVANLLKFAFNLAPNSGDLNRPNAVVLQPGGIAGLPRITRDAQGELVIEFVRRKTSSNSGIAYLVETGEDLVSWNSLSVTNASAASIDSIWERVTVSDPLISPKRFGRVRVQALP